MFWKYLWVWFKCVITKPLGCFQHSWEAYIRCENYNSILLFVIITSQQLQVVNLYYPVMSNFWISLGTFFGSNPVEVIKFSLTKEDYTKMVFVIFFIKYSTDKPTSFFFRMVWYQFTFYINWMSSSSSSSSVGAGSDPVEPVNGRWQAVAIYFLLYLICVFF